MRLASIVRRAAFLLLAATWFSAPASAATQCINLNAPNPLEFCVTDTGRPAVWVNQPNGRAHQYYGEYDWGSMIWLNGSSTAQRYSTGYWVSPVVTPVSNSASGSGTAADPYVITTIVNLGATGVRMTQVFTYVNGDRTLRKTFTIQNQGLSTFNDVRFMHGGDTFFGGSDFARSWWDPTNNMIYVTNTDFSVSGLMGFYANPATPSQRYVGGQYNIGNNLAGTTGQLPNTANSNFVDAGYYLQWNRASLAPTESWTIDSFETWSPPGALQVLTPPSDYVVPGTTVQKTFKVHNLTGGALAVNLSVAATPNGWNVSLPNGSSINLAALQVMDVPVEITVPLNATPGAAETISLTASSGSNTNAGTTRLTVLAADYTISPTSLDFGTVAAGSSSTLDVTLTNGALALPVQVAQIGGSNGLAAPFSLIADGCSNTTVLAGASCTITVRFAPTAGGTATDSFAFPILLPVITTQTISVEGSGSVNSHTVSTSAGSGGGIAPSSATVNDGATTSFTVTPSGGYSIGTVSGCSGSLAGNTFTTGAITADCTVTASFTLNSYTVSTSAGAGGGIAPSSATVNHGSTTSFTVTPSVGHSIGTVSGCGGSLAGNIYTTGAITGACTVTAAFTINSYAVTASAGAGGTISPPSTNVAYGGTTSFTVTPDAGHSIGTVSGCSGSLSGNTFTTGAITGACVVNATFTLNSYSVTASAGTGGSISPASSNVNYGATTSFNVTPDTGYSIATVTGCGGSLAGGTYTTGTITGACAVTASFSLNSYTVSATAGAGGSIGPASAVVNYGSTTTFTVTPDTGYSIANVQGCGGSLAGSTYTTGTITSACVVSASFSLNTYTVSAAAAPGGTISPASAVVDHGSTTSFTITPDTGYSITLAQGCGGSLAGNTFTTGVITGACSISVTFHQTLPVFNPVAPAPLDVDADGLMTVLPDGIAPQAFDYNGDPLTVELVGAPTHYGPGEYTLTWQTVDSRGVVSTVEQTLRIWPLVSMGPDLTLGFVQGNSGSFRIALNGTSPVYPLDVSYQVSGYSQGHDLVSGTTRFEAGELEKDVFLAITATPPSGTPNQDVHVALAAGVNRGTRASLDIHLATTNSAPVVTITATQGGETRPSFGRDGGPITLEALVSDPDTNDAHTVTWQTPNGATVTTSGGVLTLAADSLPAGIYRIEAIVTDDAQPPNTTRGVFDIVIRDTNPTLPGGVTGWDPSGLPDDPAYSPSVRNVLPERERVLDRFLIESDPGLGLALGAYSIQQVPYQAELQASAIAQLGADSIANVGGVFDFAARDLPMAGQSVQIVVPQRVAIPANAVYRKYDPATRRWKSFVEGGGDALASARGAEGYCPPPGSSQFHAGLNAGDWCVQLTMRDGGANDADAQPNGVVLDPGGVAGMSTVLVTSTGSGRGGGGGAIDSLLLLVSLIALGLRAARTRGVLMLKRTLRQWRLHFAIATGLMAPLTVMAGGPDADELSVSPPGGLFLEQPSVDTSSLPFGLGWYGGLQFGLAQGDVDQGELNDRLASQGFDVTAAFDDGARSAWRLHGGVQINPWLGAEIGYSDLGKVHTTVTGNVVDIDALLASLNRLHPHSASGFDASVIGRFPLTERISLSGHAGLFRWQSQYSDSDQAGASNRLDTSGTDMRFGVGVQFSLWRGWNLSSEWSRYSVGGEHVSFLSVGVNYRAH